MGKKKSREKKTSQGTGVGARKTRLTTLQKVLMNKGLYASSKPAGKK